LSTSGRGKFRLFTRCAEATVGSSARGRGLYRQVEEPTNRVKAYRDRTVAGARRTPGKAAPPCMVLCRVEPKWLWAGRTL